MRGGAARRRVSMTSGSSGSVVAGGVEGPAFAATGPAGRAPSRAGGCSPAVSAVASSASSCAAWATSGSACASCRPSTTFIDTPATISFGSPLRADEPTISSRTRTTSESASRTTIAGTTAGRSIRCRARAAPVNVGTFGAASANGAPGWWTGSATGSAVSSAAVCTGRSSTGWVGISGAGFMPVPSVDYREPTTAG